MFSTRLLSLSLLLVSAFNAIAAPVSQTAELAERELPRALVHEQPDLTKRAKAKAAAPARKPPTKTPAKPPAKPPARPPSRPPSPGPSKPPPPTKKAPTKTRACNTIPDCAGCIKNRCHFNKQTFVCENAGALSPNKVTTAVGCPQMAQMQKVFPKAGTAAAGVVPANLATKFAAVRNHIFQGETTNPNSGRHTLSAFRATHAGAQPVEVNARNKLQQFSLGPSNVKTVWVDGVGGYSEIDIKNMCATAIKLIGTTGGRVNSSAGTVGAVVQSPFGFPACVTFTEFNSGGGSCFPLGVFGPPGVGVPTAKLGARCLSGSRPETP